MPEKHTVELASTTPGQTGIFRHKAAQQTLLLPAPGGRSDAPHLMTLYENFQSGLAIEGGSRPCFGVRAQHIATRAPLNHYTWQSYAQVWQQVLEFGSGLMQLAHLHPQVTQSAKSYFDGAADVAVTDRMVAVGDKQLRVQVQWNVGLYSINRPEWVVCEQACNAWSLVSVALYDTLGPDTLEYCVNHAELGVIACSMDKIPALLKVKAKCPTLKLILCMDDLKPDSRSAQILHAWASEKDVVILDFKQVRALGVKNKFEVIPPRPEDIATICYTSGTTGNPKGALLMHKNFVAAANSVRYSGIDMTKEDVMISYLPLAHCFERVVEAAMYSVGGAVGFYRGDVLTLVEDVAALKPTFFPSVPRLFNRIYAKLVDGTIKAPGFRGWLFRKAVGDKLSNIRSGQGLNSAWDMVLFNRVRALLGGRVRLMITGSAPIGGDVLTFLRAVFCCEILEGYGQTECAAGSTITYPGDFTPGQVGVPLVCNEIKLVDVPEMGYTSRDKQPRGEVWIRGHNVMKGYYKDPAKTAETITSDGWLLTGDIGMITPSGTLAIIDRKKNIFKLAQGEYVAPEKLETIYTKSDVIMQCFVHGDSLESVLVGIVVPDPDVLPRRLGTSSRSELSYAEMVALPETKRLIMEEIQRMAKKHRLAGFEVLKNVHVEVEPFSVENELLTPSFKLKRNVALAKYRPILTQLYQEVNSSESASHGGAGDKSKL